MTLVNTSTNLNLARFGACKGSVMLSPSSALKKRYISAHIPNDFPYIIILGIFALSNFNLSTTGLKVVETASNLLTEYIMFFLQGDFARMYGSCIPIVHVIEYRRVLVAVAVRAIRPSKVDSLIPVSFLAGINAGGRSLFIIHYHDLMHQFSVYFNLITVKINLKKLK